MRCFKYGSRVIENERQVRLEQNVRNIGSLLHAVAMFFVTFFLFVLINFLLSNLIQNTQLTFIKLMNVLQNGGKELLTDSVLSTIYFAYQNSFALFLTVVTFTCVYQFGLTLKTLVYVASESDKQKSTYSKEGREFNTKTADVTVSYRYKVCFLS
ncbi:MAG: hypothetical protein J1G02_02295 [Clostridiales bacterium]|nr:hypothetical protein [Clostridiales bacterium]